jgi:G:T-mismatch repair DNA endonuclease (very short patch repair protein)
MLVLVIIGVGVGFRYQRRRYGSIGQRTAIIMVHGGMWHDVIGMLCRVKPSSPQFLQTLARQKHSAAAPFMVGCRTVCRLGVRKIGSIAAD